MLVESALAGAKVEYVVVGIGINVHTRALPEDVAAIATSIALERDARAEARLPALDRAEILADVLAGLDRDVELVAHKGLGIVHARLTRHDALRGRAVESVGRRRRARHRRGHRPGWATPRPPRRRHARPRLLRRDAPPPDLTYPCAATSDGARCRPLGPSS